MDHLVFLIPIVAILSGVAREWIKVQARQKALGASTDEVQKELTVLRKERQALLERIENLEAIVVTQTWDAIHDKSLTSGERELRVASTARRELPAPESTPSYEQRAQALARRLQR